MENGKTPTANASIGTILGDLADSTQTLVRKEIELVKTQVSETVSEQVSTKGKGVGLLVGGGIFAIVGLGLLGITATFGLMAAGLAAWLAALIVTVIYFVVAGALALWGKSILTPDEEPAEERTELPAQPEVRERRLAERH